MCESQLERFLENLVLYKLRVRKFAIGRRAVTSAALSSAHELGLTTSEVIRSGSNGDVLPGEVCNDLDKIVVDDKSPIVQERAVKDENNDLSGSKFRHKGYVTAEYIPDLPGYMFLKVRPDSESSIDSSMRYSSIDESLRCIIEEDGTFTSEGFLQVHGGRGGTSGDYSPAIKQEMYPTFANFVTKLDLVYSLRCPGWPGIAAAFLQRERRSGWPSGDLLFRVKRAGCVAVPAGFLGSASRHKHWCWSFPAQEKILLHSLDNARVGTLYLLKAIFNEQWKDPYPVKGKTKVCSYFLKTAMLWSVERKGLDCSMFEILVFSVEFLIEAYRESLLPNFFIPEKNLLANLDKADCDIVLKWLMYIKLNLWSVCLASMKHDPFTSKSIKQLVNECHPGYQFNYRDKVESFNTIYNTFTEENANIEMLNSLNLIVEDADFTRDMLVVYQTQGYYSWAKFLDWINKQEVEDRGLISQLPELIYLPVICDLENLVSSEFVSIFKRNILKHIGDWYHCFAAITENKDHISATCYEKTEEYYSKVKEGETKEVSLLYYVLMAKFYYLRGCRDKLQYLAEHLESLLCEAVWDDEIFYAQPYITLHPDWELSLAPWKQDPELMDLINQSALSFLYVNLHPVSLGFYILGRQNLGRDMHRAAISALYNLRKVREKLVIPDQIKSTDGLIDILSNQVIVSYGTLLTFTE